MPPQPNDPRMRVLGATLKRLREETGRSQSELAGMIGQGLDTLQNWEQGRRQPTAILLHDLLLALEVPRRRWGDVLTPLEVSRVQEAAKEESVPPGKKAARPKRPKKKGGTDS